MKVTCPVCGLEMKRVARTHLAKHNLTGVEFHALRLEAERGRPLKDFLEEVYVNRKLSSVEIYERYNITYRTLKGLLAMCEIPMRSMSDAIAASWEADDGGRSDRTSQLFKELNERRDMTGDNNPAKRPEVRRKIARAKREDNPGLVPMLEALRQDRLSNPTGIERVMIEALDDLGISYEREYRVGLYFIDFAIPSIKVAIECDGSGWHDAEHDAKRDAWLTSKGWHVFRYESRDIQTNIGACVKDLVSNLDALGIDPPATE